MSCVPYYIYMERATHSNIKAKGIKMAVIKMTVNMKAFGKKRDLYFATVDDDNVVRVMDHDSGEYRHDHCLSAKEVAACIRRADEIRHSARQTKPGFGS